MVGGTVGHSNQKLIQAIQQLLLPKSKWDVRAFLGITGHYHEFIPNYIIVVVPLTDLTKKNVPNKVVWTEQCAHAWQNLKKVLCLLLIFRSPCFSSPFILQTDAP